MVKIAIKVIQSITARPVVFLMALSLLTHLTVFGFVYAVSEAKNLRFPNLTGDSNHYRLLAEHLLAKGAFDTYPDRPSPDSFRTPGYPLFLLALFAVGGSWKAAAFFQIVILSLIGVLVYFLGKELFGKTVGLIAGALIAMDPIGLFYSTLTLSDGFFTLLFILSLLLFWRGIKGKSVLMLISGVILGFAVLARPIGQFLPVPYLLFLWFQIGDRRIWARRGAVFLVGFFIIIFPWMLRNNALFDSWQLSSVGNFNAGYFAMLFLEQKTGIPAADYEKELVGRKAGGNANVLRSLEGGVISLDFAREILREHPLEYAVFHAVKTIPFFANDGLRDIARLLGFSGIAMPNFSGLLLSGDYRTLMASFNGGGINLFLLALGSGAMGIILSLSLYGTWKAVQNPQYRIPAVFFLLLILYFAVLTGPVANARYRMPAMPLILILASFAGHAIILSLRPQNA